MKLLKNRFIKNTGWIIASKIIQMGLSLGVNMLVARYLGPANNGILNYVNSFVLFFTSFCTLGLNNIIIKEFITNPEDEGNILGSALCMRLISSIISMFALLVLIYFIKGKDKYLVLIAFLQSFALLFAAMDAIKYWYQSKLKSKTTAIVETIAYIIMSIYKILLVVFKKSLAWFAFSISLDVFIISILLLFVYKHDKGQKFSFSHSTAKRMLKQSYPFIISGLMITIYAQIDKIMLGSMMNFESVGLYTAAITITGLWNFIPSAIIESARPLIMEAKENDNDLYVHRLKQLYAVLIYLSIIYGIFITLTSKYVILLLYGKDYLGASSALVIAVWYTAFSLMGAANNIFLLCEGKNNFVQWICIIGAFTNVILNYLMIPIWGIKGAAIATLLTQVITNLIAPLFFKDIRIVVRYILEAIILKGVFKLNKQTKDKNEKNMRNRS